MVRVSVAIPDTSDEETKLVSSRCHRYVSGLVSPVVAFTVNVTVDPGSISVWFAGCWVI